MGRNTADQIMNSGKGAGKVLGGVALGGGLYVARKLAKNVKDTAADLNNRAEEVTKVLAVNENGDFVIEVNELLEGLFEMQSNISSLPRTEKEPTTFKTFSHFRSYIKE